MSFLTYLISGLSLGSIYAIIALGYTMVYGIAKMLNFAHGDFIMVGCYIIFSVTASLGGNPLLGILVAVVLCTILGITTEFVQDNQSISKKGVLRGLHFQKNHPQAKLVRVVSGKIYDVAVDLRNNSPTFAKYFGLILDSEKNNMLYISEGFAHGFYVLSDTAIVSYKCSDFYHPEDEDGIIWNDKTLSINWKNECDFINPVLSEKDLNRPVFDKEKIYFNF